ncbi:F0F1 ATP synthase subunit B [Candidatus Falkowbacteria bacterium]|nr:F0F1 ATP synthase subunit B [Candidatus Falkowbacteria bacterium]
MESLIETFHIDTKLLLAQIINFAIVFFVLYFFALKPLLKIMGERTKKIEKSLDDANEIENKLAQTKAEYEVIVAGAKKEANEIIEKAGAAAAEKKKEIITRAKEEVGQIINQEKAKMQTEKARTLKEIKKEVADLVVVSLEKILAEKVDVKKDKEIIRKAIS